MIILEGQKDTYMLVKRISENNGEAAVYLCQNKEQKNFVAKLYKRITGVDIRVRQFLYKDDSEYFVKLLDHGVAEINGNKRAFEIYEYEEEGTLSSKAPFNEYEVEKYIIPYINEAINKMHEAGIVHRDIKPDNMYFLSKSGDKEGFLVKIGDYGISAVLGSQKTYCDAALAFTPGYVPAEVLGAGMYSPASDYYAFAVSIYYLITGKQIYEGLTPDEIMIKTRRGGFNNYEGINARIASLLEGLMVQDPRYRWGYKEVIAWLQGSNVPVFRYSQEEQILDPPYQFSASISCNSLKKLSDALCDNPEEAKKHLYEGLLADSLRKKYQYISAALTELTVNKFPHSRNAGLSAAIKILDPKREEFYWNKKLYTSLSELMDELCDEMISEKVTEITEELMQSDIISYWYKDKLSDTDILILKEIKSESQKNAIYALCRLVMSFSSEIYYYPEKNIKVKDIGEYIDYINGIDNGINKALLRDFSRVSFAFFMKSLGFSRDFNEWKQFFYKEGFILDDRYIVGNVFQLLEKICPEKQAKLSSLYISLLKKEPEFWLKAHLNLYDMDEILEHIVHNSFFSVKYKEDMSISELAYAQQKMVAAMGDLRRDFLNNYFLYENGVYNENEYRIVSKNKDAYFVEDITGVFVPVGWMLKQDTLQEKELVNKGFYNMKNAAVSYINMQSEKTNRWFDDCMKISRTKKTHHKFPSIIGGMLSLIVSVVMLVLWGKLAGNLLEGSSLLTKAGFMITFLSLVLWIASSGIRILRYAIWRKAETSVGNIQGLSNEMEEISKVIKAKSLNEEYDPVIEPVEGNIITEAQEQRAYSNYVIEYKKMKNNLLIGFSLTMISLAILLGGIYADGSIKFNSSNLKEQVSSLISEKNDDKPAVSNNKKPSKMKVIASNARLRKGAGINYEIMNSYEKDTEVTLTGKKQSDGKYIWYQVETPDGTTGWMRNDTISE